jgi:hypothetical protein
MKEEEYMRKSEYRYSDNVAAADRWSTGMGNLLPV